MAHDDEKKELVEKVVNLCKERFGGDYRKLFDHYHREKTPEGISREELGVLLEDAGIGNWLSRGMWVTGILEALDTGRDGSISWAEFEAVLHPRK